MSVIELLRSVIDLSKNVFYCLLENECATSTLKKWQSHFVTVRVRFNFFIKWSRSIGKTGYQWCSANRLQASSSSPPRLTLQVQSPEAKPSSALQLQVQCQPPQWRWRSDCQTSSKIKIRHRDLRCKHNLGDHSSIISCIFTLISAVDSDSGVFFLFN